MRKNISIFSSEFKALSEEQKLKIYMKQTFKALFLSSLVYIGAYAINKLYKNNVDRSKSMELEEQVVPEVKKTDKTHIANNTDLGFYYGQDSFTDVTLYRYGADIKKDFDIGEHVLFIRGYVSSELLTKEINGYNKYVTPIQNSDNELLMWFVNSSPISATGKLNQTTDEYEFRDFGEVQEQINIEHDTTDYILSDTTKSFEVGEHSIPLDIPAELESNKLIQIYNIPKGYEISNISYGNKEKYLNLISVLSINLENKELVTVNGILNKSTSEVEYNTFGKPVEMNKTL